MKNRNETPRALRETWEWKKTVCEETNGMTTADALKLIHRKVTTICESYGFLRADISHAKPMVGEAPAAYGDK